MAHNFQSVLIDNASATEADVKSSPITSDKRFYLISLLITGIESIISRRVAAETNPAILDARFRFDFFGIRSSFSF